jgi:hypothetical protein
MICGWKIDLCKEDELCGILNALMTASSNCCTLNSNHDFTLFLFVLKYGRQIHGMNDVPRR